jgi:hypothetical protein
MDPLSILSATAAALSACVTASNVLSSAISQVKTVDKRLLQLQTEVKSLNGFLNSLHKSLQDPKLKKASLDTQTGQVGEYWRNVKLALEVCKGPLHRLEEIVRRVEGSSSGSKRTQPARAIRLNFSSAEITELRQDVQMGMSSIMIALQMLPM